MFYRQFSEIVNELNPEFVEEFDYWLTTLPTNNRKNLTASAVASRLKVSFSQAELILKFAEKKGILERYFLVSCPECDKILKVLNENELAEALTQEEYCYECDEYRTITPDDICIAYKVILLPDITEEELKTAIEKRLGLSEPDALNFTGADSLSQEKDILYHAFYIMDESAYGKLHAMREKLKGDFENTTAQGQALEELVLAIFCLIKSVSGSSKIKTDTNQFDCTLLSKASTSYPSVFNVLEPYFIIECKNEDKKPGNTYFNKLIGIMEHNEAKVGIVFSRKPATKTCWKIAREHYLAKSHARKQEYLLAMDDKDLDYIIDRRVNLLTYLQFKIFQITADSPTSTWEMFENN